MISIYTRNVALIILLICASLLFFGCDQAAEPDYFSQAFLPQPDKIEISSGTNLITYEKESNQYEKVFTTISKNWWKTAEKTPAYVDNGDLVNVVSLESLRTTTDRTSVTANDVIIRFLYTSTAISWDISVEETKKIQLIAFILPQDQTQNVNNILGFFTIAQTDNLGTNEGLYTYYYAPELTNDFWSYLSK